MEDLLARTIVENLSVGINPLTGEAVHDTDCCANELVQEAIRTVLEHCSLESYATLLEKQREEKKRQRAEKREERRKLCEKRYTNSGRPWSENDDELLVKLYVYQKRNIWQIANIMKRTPGAIASRLRKRGI